MSQVPCFSLSSLLNLPCSCHENLLFIPRINVCFLSDWFPVMGRVKVLISTHFMVLDLSLDSLFTKIVNLFWLWSLSELLCGGFHWVSHAFPVNWLVFSIIRTWRPLITMLSILTWRSQLFIFIFQLNSMCLHLSLLLLWNFRPVHLLHYFCIMQHFLRLFLFFLLFLFSLLLLNSGLLLKLFGKLSLVLVSVVDSISDLSVVFFSFNSLLVELESSFFLVLFFKFIEFFFTDGFVEVSKVVQLLFLFFKGGQNDVLFVSFFDLVKEVVFWLDFLLWFLPFLSCLFS